MDESTPSLFSALRIEGGRVTAELAPDLGARFFRDDFRAEYPSGVEPQSMPRSIVQLPALYAVAPVVWASGGRYAVDGLDTRTAAALDRLRAELQRMFPSMSWRGEVVAREPGPVAEARPSRRDAAVLFSTGADSLATVHRLGGQRLVLVSVGLDDDHPLARWRLCMEEARRFAADAGHEHVQLTSNARSFLDLARLADLGEMARPWWPRIAHGMSYLGLAAPVAYAFGARHLVIAASDTVGFESAWGSTPHLDPLVAIGPATVVHDGADTTRLQRIESFVEPMRHAGTSFALRVCHRIVPDGIRNCGRCEKCFRTTVCLLLADADPRSFGFPEFSPQVLRHGLQVFHAGGFKIDEGEAAHWSTLVPPARDGRGRRLDGTSDFMDWLASMDFEAYRMQWHSTRRRPRPSRLRRARGVLRRVAGRKSASR